MIFGLEGNLIGSWGDWAVLPHTPHSCAVDRWGNLYVAETNRGRRVHKFTPVQ